MSMQASANDAAQLILSVFVSEFNCRPGETLRVTSFYRKFAGHREDEHFVAGKAYATERGWIEIVDDNVLRLTAHGYAEALNPGAADAAANRPPCIVTLAGDEADFILRLVSGESVTEDPPLMARIKEKLQAAMAPQEPAAPTEPAP